MKQNINHQPIDPDLEARVFAFVMGEASESEQVLLQQMIEERSDLAALKDHFAKVHGLLSEIGTGEAGTGEVTGDDSWTLPTVKRDLVLSVIDGKNVGPAKEPTKVEPNVLQKKRNWQSAKRVAGIAAVFCLVTSVGAMLLIPAVHNARESTQAISSIAASKELREDLKGGSVLNYEYQAPEKPGSRQLESGLAESKFDRSGISTNAAEELGFDESFAPVTPATKDHRWSQRDLPRAPTMDADIAGFATDGMQAPVSKSAPPALTADPYPSPILPSQSLDAPQFQSESLGDSDFSIGGYPARTGRIVLGGSVNQDAGQSGQQDGAHRGRQMRLDPKKTMGAAEGSNFSDDISRDLYGIESAPGVAGNQSPNTYWSGSGFNGKRAESSSGEKMGRARYDDGRFSSSNSSLGEEDELAQTPLDAFLPKNKELKDRLSRQAQLGRRKKSKRIAGGAGDSIGFLNDSDESKFTESEEVARPSIAQQKIAETKIIEETDARQNAFSTFSLHVGDVSFKLAQAALSQGQWPEAAKIRIEEFVNALTYDDPMPCHDEKVACQIEQAIHPFVQQRNVLRVSMRTAAAGRASNIPLRLTLLLDSSGSMERIDRRQTVRRAFAALASQLKPIDQVTLISFARTPRLLADKVSGAQASGLVQMIETLPSDGGTNLESAIELAFEKAKEQQADDAQSRIILLTDGAVNLGDANPTHLFELVKTIRNAGIAFDAAGISASGLNDEVLEALTRSGDGRYYLLDSSEDAEDGFAQQIAGALRPSAKNVKVQVEFNPLRVGRYRLLGFEKHLLNKEDFRNDAVDAAEMAAAESGVAVYQFEPKADGEGDVGSVSVRFRDLSTGEMIENRWPIPYQPDAARLEQSTPSLRIATSAAMFAAALRGDSLGQSVDLKTLSDLMSGLPESERRSKRVGQLKQMINQARQVSGR